MPRRSTPLRLAAAAITLLCWLGVGIPVSAQSDPDPKQGPEAIRQAPSSGRIGITSTQRPAPANRTVTPAAGCPSISLAPPRQLPTGWRQRVYRHQLESVGGQAPIEFYLASQVGLPPGLRLSPDGVISGVPEAAGTYRFSVAAVDSCPQGPRRATGPFVLTVAEAAPQGIMTESAVVSPPDGPAARNGLVITGLDLFFPNGPSSIVVPQHHPVPDLTAQLQVQGQGVVAGYWITPQKHKLYFSQPVQAPGGRLTYPAGHSLASDTPGHHTVRLVLTAPGETPPGAVAGYVVVREVSRAPQVVPQQLVVTVAAKAQARLVGTLGATYGLKLKESHELASLAESVLVFETEDALLPLAARVQDEPGVLLAHPNLVFTTLAEPKERLQRLSRELDFATLHGVYRGRGVTVAVIDTGVDRDHEDLRGNIRDVRNLLPQHPFQSEIHGTAVAGIIAAALNDQGIAGVAPEAKILALRACRQIAEANPRGEGTSVSIARAIDAALIERVDIVNMSFGAGTPDRLVARLIRAGYRRGVLFVAPVGNSDDREVPAFPAALEQVIAVGGVTQDGTLFPNRALAEVAAVRAPCDHLLTTVPGGRYNFLDGTSLSAAVVSGVLALALEKRSGLPSRDIAWGRGDLRQWTTALLGVTLPN